MHKINVADIRLGLPEFEVKEKQIDDNKYSYFEAGEGKPLILLPGFPFGKELYSLVIPGLALNKKVIALDLPGWGESGYKQEITYSGINKWLYKYVNSESRSIDLFGYSFGGSIALRFINDYPELVDRVSVYSPAIKFSRYMDPIKSIFLQFANMSPKIRQIFFKELISGGGNLHKIMFGVEMNIQNPYHQKLYESLQKVRLEPFFETLKTIFGTDLAPDLSGITKEVNIVTGEKDYIKTDSFEAIKLLKKSHLIVIPRVTHNFIDENPAKFQEVLSKIFN